MKITWLISLGIILFKFSACSQVENPCIDRIDYSIIDDATLYNMDSLFLPPTETELSTILGEWSTFDMASSDVEVIDEYELLNNRNIQVIQHRAEGRIHYGAIIQPQNFDTTRKYPLMIWADGLSQDNPLVSVESGYGGGFAKSLPEHFVVIPSFRGQSLNANGNIYCSDGFFGDAYDGATDDALRILQVALDAYKTAIDDDKLSIYGGSRGGTVALLAAVRYPQIYKVISQSGPVQFHHRSGYERYGFQFRYQFLHQHNTFAMARQKMIKASPIYFLHRYSNKLMIAHGRNDTVVPLWNAEAVQDARKDDPNFEYLLTDDGHSVRAGELVSAWIRKE